MYTIYEIPGVKVGCTSRSPEIRVKEQGYKEYKILEVLNDITLASQRERYWQEKLGYRKETISYSKIIQLQKATGSVVIRAKAVCTFKESGKKSEKYIGSRSTKHMCTPEARIKSKTTKKTSQRFSASVQKGLALMHTPESWAKIKKPVKQFNKEGVFIREWPGIKDASIELNIKGNNISAACTGKQKTAGGYIWKYKKPLSEIS